MKRVNFTSSNANATGTGASDSANFGKYRWTETAGIDAAYGDEPAMSNSPSNQKGSMKAKSGKRGSVLGSLPSAPSFSQPKKAGEHWMKDGDSKTCMICNTTFTLSRRRHHCRKCGRLVCAECSKTRMAVGVAGAAGDGEHDHDLSMEDPATVGGQDAGAAGAVGSKGAKAERWCDGESVGVREGWNHQSRC